QAEDGIRDRNVTGVQTCALPILGQEISVEVFQAGDKIDVTGTSKGKGFQGSIKRHNFATGAMSHGSRFHRGSGSMGSMDGGRVFKGKKLPGQMGAEQVTIQNLEIVNVDTEKNLLLKIGRASCRERV